LEDKIVGGLLFGISGLVSTLSLVIVIVE